MADRSATAEKDLLRAYGIGKKEGLQHVYIGNLPSAGYESTVCPSCGAVAVERSGFEVNNKTANGICRKCNYQLKGIWI
jgi:pyruvate formate lyase activating enzyme